MGNRQTILAVCIFAFVMVAYLGSYPRRLEAPDATENGQEQTDQTANDSQISTVLYYPMTAYESRLRVRPFGQLVKHSDVLSPCGAAFSGYHDADDLEVTDAEIDSAVPVYAAGDGRVGYIDLVSGYGGLLVIEVAVNGQLYTVYYGHVDLGSTTLAVGDAITAGQQLALLGDQCSNQTGGERKHLHFAIRKGVAIDFRGYLPTSIDLETWVNPRIFLSDNSAVVIK